MWGYSLIVIIKLSDFAGYFANLPALQSVLGVEHQAMLLLELPQLCVDIKGASKVRLPLPVAILRQISVWNHMNISLTCRVYFSHRTHLSPLKSCLDFSSRWQNSKTSFLSCSSVDSIFTMPFSAAPKCYVCEPVVLLGNEGNRLKSSCRK